MVITFTDRCLHHVNPWSAPIASECDPLTPGRIGVVGFFPAASLSYLENKPPGWATDTALGQQSVVI